MSAIKPFVRLEMTCEAVPSQWDAWDADGRYYYIRYRGGWLSVAGDDVLGESLYVEVVGDHYDGVMNETEMLEHIGRSRV